MIFFITLDLTAIQIDLEENEETIEAKMSVRGDIMEYCKHMACGLLITEKNRLVVKNTSKSKGLEFCTGTKVILLLVLPFCTQSLHCFYNVHYLFLFHRAHICHPVTQSCGVDENTGNHLCLVQHLPWTRWQDLNASG